MPTATTLAHPGGPAGPNRRHRANLPGLPASTVPIAGFAVAGTMGLDITSQAWGPGVAWRPVRDPCRVTPTCDTPTPSPEPAL
jgi:hypothetical protein